MCFLIFWEKQQLMSFFIQYLHLNFHSFSAYQHGSGSSVKAVMPLSVTLPLVIGLFFFWFLIAIAISKSSHTWISFLDPKDLCLPNQFSRGSLQKPSTNTYLTWCQRRNWVTSMIELTLILNPSYAYHTIWTFSDQYLL